MKQRDLFQIPAWLKRLIENKWLGDKTGQGFFKKIKLPVTEGSPEERKEDKEIHTLNLKTLGICTPHKTKVCFS